jgi:branched-chain amino acid transport system permease protein
MSLRYKLGLVGLAGLAALPMVIDPTMALMFATAYFWGVYAMSWDAVSGYTGQISFGHSMFFAIGGYGSAILNLEMGLSPLMSIPIAMVLAAVAGVIIGVPALRLRGPYLSLVTLIAPIILLGLFKTFSGITGGEQGPGSPDNLLGLGFRDVIPFYYIAFGLFLLVMVILLAITRSDAGRIFTAIRESEDAVNSAGLNPAKFKIFAFVLSAALGGLAGAAFVHTPRANPTAGTLLELTVNIEIFIAVIIGGMGTIVGAALGGVLFFIAQNLLGGTLSSDVSLLLFAVTSLVIVYALPGGLLRGSIVGGRKLLNRGDSNVAADGGRTPLEQVYDKYSGFLGGDDDDE